jgi:hypothetical protein
MDYTTSVHKVLLQFVSLPSEAYPEAGEQRVRARVAVVSGKENGVVSFRACCPNGFQPEMLLTKGSDHPRGR